MSGATVDIEARLALQRHVGLGVIAHRALVLDWMDFAALVLWPFAEARRAAWARHGSVRSMRRPSTALRAQENVPVLLS